MPTLRFTQFLMPNGRQVPVETEVSEEARKRADVIEAAGLRFEIEMLRNGMISATITHPEDGDLAHSLTRNGPEVQAGIENMIAAFNVERLA